MNQPILKQLADVVLGFCRTVISRWTLVKQLTVREIQDRYQGSLVGRSWSILYPLMMLCVYTFVFSVILQGYWISNNNDEPNHLNYAVNLFTGLIAFNLFAEPINAAPQLILRKPIYVKQLVFPLELLNLVTVAASVFHALTSLLILLIFQLLIFGTIHLSVLWLPFIWLPLILLTLCMSWLISCLAVFLRDMIQIVPVMVTMLMFLSGIFYPISILPIPLRSLLFMNPLTIAVDQTRIIVVTGGMPNLTYICIGIFAGLILCCFTLFIFQRSRHAFADVI